MGRAARDPFHHDGAALKRALCEVMGVEPTVTQMQLAEMLGVTQSMVSMVLGGSKSSDQVEDLCARASRYAASQGREELAIEIRTVPIARRRTFATVSRDDPDALDADPVTPQHAMDAVNAAQRQLGDHDRLARDVMLLRLWTAAGCEPPWRRVDTLPKALETWGPDRVLELVERVRAAETNDA